MSQSIKNLQNAMLKLNEYLALAANNDTDYMHAAVIQAFEFNFELFWKTYQKIANQEGEKIGSPKQAFSYAFQSGLIEDEATWVTILKDRNLTTHTYHQEIADQIYGRIRDTHIHAFEQALQVLLNKR